MADFAAASAYGGPGWSPRTASLRREIGALWGSCGVSTEWATLKAVLLHEPGRELGGLAEPDACLMLETLHPDLARRQHAGLAEAYRRAGVAVHYVEPAGPAPPNLMFVADLLFMTPEGVIVGRPASTVRAGEERLVARRLAERGIPILRTVRGAGTFEGADAAWIDPQTVLLATGLRTNTEGAAQVAATLGELGVQVIPAGLPYGTMHLMGVLRLADRDVAIAWPGRVPYAAVDALRTRGYTVLFLPAPAAAERRVALNFVTLGPRRILMAAGHPNSKAFFEDAGIDCQTVEVDELAKAAGGIGCLTGILEREQQDTSSEAGNSQGDPASEWAGVQPTTLNPGRSFAQQLDAHDELAPVRQCFVIADPDMIYLDGNSLGRLPRRAAERVQELVQLGWGADLIRSWNAGWWEAPKRLGDKVSLLVGAAPGQVVVGDSTSVDLFKLTMAALALRPDRPRIVSDTMNFPTDLYVLQGCCRLLGNRHSLHLVTPGDGIAMDLRDLFHAIDETTALVTLSHVAFKSGYLYDAAAVTERAHQAGALVLWDLSHSVGAVPIDLDGWGADLAVGCTYKYLNGGPGAPAFLYVRQDLQEASRSPIWGWWGQRSPFAFDLQYEPAPGIGRFLAGSQPILSLLAMEPGLDLTIEAGVERIRHKSVALTSTLIDLVDAYLAPLGFELGSPRDPQRRGSHVSIRHAEAYRINRALIDEMHVIPDFRDPDNIRLGLAPLYTTFAEVWEAVDRIRRVVVEERYLHYPAGRLRVT